MSQMMSSEESDVDDEGDAYVPLPWRASIVDEFFYSFDEQFHSEKSPQAKRQTKPRLKGTNESVRSIPTSMPAWAVM